MNEQNGKAIVSEYNKISFKAGEILPDAPVGGWDATIVRNKSSVRPNKNKDPMVEFRIRLDKADEDENEYACGTQLSLFLIFVGDNSATPTFAKNRTKATLADLCGQVGVELDIIPQELTDPPTDLRPFIDACEGKSVRLWTTHRVDGTGRNRTELSLRAPGNFGAPSARE